MAVDFLIIIHCDFIVWMTRIFVPTRHLMHALCVRTPSGTPNKQCVKNNIYVMIFILILIRRSCRPNHCIHTHIYIYIYQ